jgi:hypothetical protein
VSQISSEIVANPFSEGADFHLAIANRSPGTESFLFIPQSDSPGLTIDILRLDLLPRRFQRLRDLYETIKAGLVSYAGPERAHCELLSSSPTDLVFSFGFIGHPLAGGQNTVGRLTDLGSSIRSLQVLRKIEPLTSEELTARVAFVSGVQGVDMAVLRRHPQSGTEFIRNCLDSTRRLVAAATAKSGDGLRDMASLRKLVIQASPLHETLYWALLAKLVAADILERGELESFNAARRMLGLAVLDFDDARSGGEQHFFRQRIRDALDPLAELFLYNVGGDRAAQVRRAAEIWRLCVGWDLEREPDRAGQSEVMAAFAQSISRMNRNPPLDAGLGGATAAALHKKEAVQRIVEGIYGVCSRMAHVARRSGGNPTLLLAACLGADFAQLLIERATVLGNLGFDTFMGNTSR